MAQAVAALRGALGAARSFDPPTASGIVRVAALDARQAVLIPPFAAALRQHAPGLRLSVLPLAGSGAVEALLDGRVDLSVGFPWDMPEVILDEALYAETCLVAGLPGVPPAPLDLDAYCVADHVLVTPCGDLRGVVDEQLAALSRSRCVVLGLPGILPALAAVAVSEALVTLPARVATAFAPAFGLVTAAPPLEIRSFPVSVFWHRRNDADMRTQWL